MGTMLKNSRWVLVVCCALTLFFQLYLCFFFSDPNTVPNTGDHNPSTYTRWRFQLPAEGFFNRDYWYGFGNLPVGLDPLGLLTWIPVPYFFTSTFALCAVVLILGYYRLGREIGLRREVSAVGGMFLAWQGDYLGFVLPGHYGNAPQWALVPWMFWLAVRALRDTSGEAAGRGTLAGIGWRGWYAAALCGGVAGAIVSLLVDRGGLFTLVLAGMFFYEAWQRNRAGDIRRRLQPIMLLTAVTVVAMMTAAPTLVATWKISGSDTIKGASDDPVQKYAWATALSFPPEEIITYFVPGFNGWSSGNESGPYWGRVGSQDSEDPTQKVRNFSLGSAVIGTIPFGLALLGFVALFRCRGKDGNRELQRTLDLGDETAVRLAWYFAGAMVLTLLLAMGKYTPVHWLFYQLPMQEHWRNPIKFLAPFNFCATFMATIALQWICMLVVRRSALALPENGAAPAEEAQIKAGKEFTKAVSPVVVYAMVLTGAVVAVFVIFLLPGAMALSGLLSAEGYPVDFVNAAVGTARATLMVAAISAGLLLAAIHMGFYPERWRSLEIANPSLQRGWLWVLDNANRPGAVLLLMGIVCMLQMSWVHSQHLVGVNALAYTKPNEAVAFLKKDKGIYRVGTLGDDPMGYRRIMLGNLFPANGIASIETAAVSRTPRDYAGYFVAMHENLQRHYFLGGVKYVLGLASMTEKLRKADMFKNQMGASTYLESMANEQNGEPYAVVEMLDYMAKVTLVPGVEVFEDPERLLQRLPDLRWSPRRTALVMKPDSELLPALSTMRMPTPAPLGPPPAIPASTQSGVGVSTNSATPAPTAAPASTSTPTPETADATNIPAQGSGGSSPEETNMPAPATPPENKPAVSAPLPSVTSSAPASDAATFPGQGQGPLAAPVFHTGTSTGAGNVSVTQFDEHVTAFQATTKEPVIAVINDHYETDWRATVNGIVVPIVRVNQVMMGIPLPAGTSSVVLRYAPSPIPTYLGMFTWVALLLFGSAQLLMRRAAMPQVVASTDQRKVGKK